MMPGLPFEALVKIHEFKDEGKMMRAESPQWGPKTKG